MAHQRKSELNRFLQDAVNPDIPYGLPTDDLHPDGEPQANVPPPGAPAGGGVCVGAGRSVVVMLLWPSSSPCRRQR